MKFFEFKQNNSGGSFVVNDNLTNRVLIQADNTDEAINIAESLGMYWNGCDEGIDCTCCGDRWKPCYEIIFPYSYGPFDEKTAESLANKYNVDFNKSERKKLYSDRKWDVVFTTPEIYMQYLADAYGSTEPDGYIYYKSGRKVSISIETSDRR